MQIQVNTDNHISGGGELNRQVESVVLGAVDRFSERITRVEVHLSDRNSGTKAGSSDKRCVMEARLGGMRPITVSEDGESVERVLEGAAGKLQKTIHRTLERLSNPKGRTSFSGGELASPD